MIPQGSLLYSDLPSYHPANQLYFPIEGNVIDVLYPHEERNRSKREIEYDIQPLTPHYGIIRNAILAVGMSGFATAGNCITLTPASTYIPQGKDKFSNQFGLAAATDGDRVLVQFLNGAFHSPIITAVLAHRQLAAVAKDIPSQYAGGVEILAPLKTGEDGYAFGDGSAGKTAAILKGGKMARQYHQQINGTHLAVDNNGDIFLNFKAHPDTNVGIKAGDVTKKFVLQNEGQDLLRIEVKSGGDVEVVLGGNQTSVISIGKIGGTQVIVQDGEIDLGKASPGDAAAVASLVEQEIQAVIDWLSQTLLVAYAAHTHTTSVGPSGPPVPPPVTPPTTPCASVASAVVLLEKP